MLVAFDRRPSAFCLASTVADLFHPYQSIEENADRIDENRWYLVTWGGSVTVEQPVRLCRRLAIVR